MTGADLLDWLSLLLRWFHVIAGIMWIGTTYLFNWMERALTPPGEGKPNIMGELWMVHGGGFYLVEKQRWPELMPKTLHWFKWESMLTWLSGFLLLSVVYWAGAPLMSFESTWSRGGAIGLSLGSLVAGRVIYDLVWRSPLGASELLGAFVSWLLTLALAWGLGHVFSDRSVYLHVGAVFGTIMVTNVWMVILPNQTKMLAITKAGGTPDPELSRRAARASKHNTFLSVPLLLTMISNHYPAITFGTPNGLLVLAVLIPFGWLAAKVIRDHL